VRPSLHRSWLTADLVILSFSATPEKFCPTESKRLEGLTLICPVSSENRKRPTANQRLAVSVLNLCKFLLG